VDQNFSDRGDRAVEASVAVSAKVARMRQDLAAGTYVIDVERIAHALLAGGVLSVDTNQKG